MATISAHWGDGMDRAKRALGPYGRVRRDRVLKDLLGDVAQFAEDRIRIHAPQGGSGYLDAHIGKAARVYEPGAPGGGGGFSITTGVRRGTSLHPLYVHKGTKQNFGEESIERAATMPARRASKSGAMIAPTTGRIYPVVARVLKIQRNGEIFYRRYSHGQVSQPFVMYAALDTGRYIRLQLELRKRLFFPYVAPR